MNTDLFCEAVGKEQMKLKALLLLLSVCSELSTRNTKNVTLWEPVTLAGIALEKGEYRLEWEGPETQVQVTFWRGNEKVITVPSTFHKVHHPYEAITVLPEASEMDALIEIDWKECDLRFK